VFFQQTYGFSNFTEVATASRLARPWEVQESLRYIKQKEISGDLSNKNDNIWVYNQQQWWN
jgi:hypothetical protein